MKQGDIDIYTYGDSKLKLAIELCEGRVSRVWEKQVLQS